MPLPHFLYFLKRMQIFVRPDVNSTNEQIFAELGYDIYIWDRCSNDLSQDSTVCIYGHGPTLALPNTVPSTARMNLTAACSPFMAAMMALFFTCAPKHYRVWTDLFARRRKMITKNVAVHADVTTNTVGSSHARCCR